MKNLRLFFNSLMILTGVLFFSCSKDADPVPPDELEGLVLTETISHNDYLIELYTHSGRFQTGYNAIFLQIKKSDGTKLKNNTPVTWNPIMHMTEMSHSCPASPIAGIPGTEFTFGGFIAFQMAGVGNEYWDLTLKYDAAGSETEVTKKIQVGEAPKRVVQTFTGLDEFRYVVALVEPANPKIGVNDMQAILYRMVSRYDFIPVSNYKIKIDPRMPSMENHSSENNVDMANKEAGFYAGKVNLTMTGYWKINLQVINDENVSQKGEPITKDHPASTLFFELEF